MPKEIINQIARQIELIRSRKMSSEGFIKLEASVRKLVMDSVSISKGQKKQKWASIHLNKNHYVSSRYQNEHITYRIHVERAYHGMIELGYLRELKSGVNTPTVKYLTRYEATDKLVSLFKADDLSSLAVTKPVIENPELIRVRLNIDGERRLVEYDESSQTRKMRENVVFINSVISRQWYDLELTDAGFLELEERMHQRSLERNEGDGRLRLHDRQLYRVFNSLDFDKGGRFYGGWWEGIPSEYRAKLLINGKRTEELDFGSLHPTILYAKHGLSLPKDAYEITIQPSTVPEGQSRSDFRKVVKRAFNAMLNAENRLNTSPRNLNLHSWGIRWEEIVAAIERKHELIAGEFFSGVGLELQYEDSQIAEEVMMTFAKQQGLVPLLPVHDSFICHHGYKKDVLKLMHDIFKARYGVNIQIKESEKKIEHLSGVSEEDPDELFSYMDTPFEKRLDYFRENNA